MKVRIPISFKTKVVPLGKRSPKHETAYEWVDAEIKILTDLDAPIATEWINKDGAKKQTRWYEGCHWSPATEREHDRSMTKSYFMETLAMGDSYLNPLPIGSPTVLRNFIDGEMKSFNASDYREIVESNRDEIIAKVHEKAGSFILIGDEVWSRGAEPIYSFQRSNYTREGATTTFRPELWKPKTYEERPSAVDLYRADEWDVLILDAGKDRIKELQIDETARITIYIPESISYEGEKLSLLDAVQRLIESRKDERIGSNATYSLRAYCDLLEASTAANETWTDQTIGNLETAADTYIAVLPTEYMSKVLAKGLNRWRNRPIEFNFDLGTTPGL